MILAKQWIFVGGKWRWSDMGWWSEWEVKVVSKFGTAQVIGGAKVYKRSNLRWNHMSRENKTNLSRNIYSWNSLYLQI